MERLTVDLGSRSYPILIGDGLIRDIGAHVAPLLRRPRTMIVTDSNVAPHYLVGVGASLANDNISFSSLVLPAGEGTKSWEGLARLTEWLIGEGIERSDHVIALGGGVIGDLVGFACSIVKRGCHFIQVPTTLLAQVDSSVGGKTAISVPAGKNLIGAFHQPALVVIDPTTLATLPRRELGAGYAEVVKYGLIDDAAFFDWCEANGAALLAGDAGARHKAIAHSVGAKARIVAADERETQDIRALLNLGHSFGHALEAETGYSDRLLHGEAVAAGMVLAHQFSAANGLCPLADADRVRDHLASVDLPHSLASAGVNTGGAALAAHMAHDKKVRGGKLPLILTRGIGQSFVTDEYGLDAVAAFLDR
ncbi:MULTISPECIES: 3-dehydroquinate synthase [unclassified Sphingopyxis]|uniref:3-dehydroquinate synthase n=1 Tax=unclassified Sphingopyxis TaxID=2614943 RepID=UPI00073054FC|nr:MULTISPECIES: 3-dehydroquinate synthase [unclassified Sphingopyxis]KTE28022.1 3-dehydroquinate synthase [Sphingopyxis sp. H057]KTE55599.1 3-dehydroquinate synthase [Sphingopyxis sp. H073]KTE57519.1 3-dehydroquinate synthase [Sphingopyxis sp. H071]KTE61605.1 3-dehydroquinate synthase [Sphingopyxis sp. H107]KTE66486.1 3-dehydroquinate synthase [Sphingopyxis sp. H100]